MQMPLDPDVADTAPSGPRIEDYHEFLPLLDVKRAHDDKAVAFERCEAIPEDKIMYRAEKLFQAAVHEAAPEPWLHAAIGLMLDSMPNAKNVSPT